LQIQDSSPMGYSLCYEIFDSFLKTAFGGGGLAYNWIIGCIGTL
jgi:hypothetical protein